MQHIKTKPLYRTMEFDIRRVKRAEIDDMLKFRNAIFGHISHSQWEAMGCTAIVAKKGKRLYGAIPLQYRDFKINPRLSIPVVFENAVGVAEKARGIGLGCAMLDFAARSLRASVDALYVYRGGERTAGYRFYRKTHHGDLYYNSTLILNKPIGANNNVDVLSIEEAVPLEKTLLSLFNSCYGRFGGYWKREKGYLRKMFDSHVLKNKDWKFFLLRRRGEILGYAISNPQHPVHRGGCVYDFVGPGIAAREALFAKIEWIAKRDKQPVTMEANREHPLFQPLIKRGYTVKGNSPYIMGRIIRPDRIFTRLAQNSSLLKDLRLEAVTPHRDLVLNRPARPKYKAKLYLKESQLSRLLSCRLDMARALETNLIRLSPLPSGLEKALSKIFRFCPWVSFGIDYI